MAKAKTNFNLEKEIESLEVQTRIKAGLNEYIKAKKIEIKTKDDLKRIVKEFLKHNLEVK